MPYRFQCDACGYDKRIYLDDYNDDHKTCEDCGTDGCDHCLESFDGDLLCDDCLDNRQEILLDNEDDGA